MNTPGRSNAMLPPSQAFQSTKGIATDSFVTPCTQSGSSHCPTQPFFA